MKKQTKTEQLQISYDDLGVLISSLYFGGDRDFTYTEDLIDFLTSDTNRDKAVIMTTKKPVDDNA